MTYLPLYPPPSYSTQYTVHTNNPTQVRLFGEPKSKAAMQISPNLATANLCRLSSIQESFKFLIIDFPRILYFIPFYKDNKRMPKMMELQFISWGQLLKLYIVAPAHQVFDKMLECHLGSNSLSCYSASSIHNKGEPQPCKFHNLLRCIPRNPQFCLLTTLSCS